MSDLTKLFFRQLSCEPKCNCLIRNGHNDQSVPSLFPPQDDGGVTGIFTHIFEHGLWRVGIVVENTTLFFPPLGDMRIKMETEMGSRNSAERLLAQVNGKTAWVASYLEKPLPRKRLITTTTTATHIEVGKNVVRTMLHTVPFHHD